MEAVLLRTGSGPVHSPAISSPRVFLSRQDSITSVFSGERHSMCSPRISLSLDRNRQRNGGIRRALSESEIYGSDIDVFGCFSKLNRAGSRSFPARIPEEDLGDCDEGGSSFTTTNENDHLENIGSWPSNSIPVEFSSGGLAKGRRNSGNGGDSSKIGDRYRELLKSNPTDPLLLRNYGKYLDEVEQDTEKAEEYYGRAILASPGDGEVLSLYANLIWKSHRDEERAKTYFDQAVLASPNDCTVLGSYARFLWESEEEEEDKQIIVKDKATPAIIAAF